MNHVLVTGFEPWGIYTRNPSQLVAESLHGEEVAGRRIEARVLPVSYRGVDSELPPLLEERPALILHLGLHPSAYAVHVETFAVNVADAGPDSEGVVKRGEPVVAGGPAAYRATIPVYRVVEAVRKKGIPARVSYHAGTFLCNYLFYRSLHLAGSGTRVGFIHLPRTPDMALDGSAPVMPLGMEVEAVREAIGAALGRLTP